MASRSSKIDAMINHNTCEVFFDNLEVPAENLIGEEGQGFKYILDSMNAERILIASECSATRSYFIKRATDYAKERVVFGRPIGQNQGVQFPIARSLCADDGGRHAGAEGRGAVRGRPRLRRGSQHGQDAGVRGGVEGRAKPACRHSAASAMRASTTSSASGARRASTRRRRSPPTWCWPIVGQHVLGMPRSY